MSRLNEMFSFIPEFMGEFVEINKIITAEEPEFDLLMQKIQHIQNQLYIETATEEGLEKYESLLNIKSTSADLSVRRANVLALWYSDMPFTIRTLIQRLSVLQGNDNVDAWVEEFLLHVKIDLTTAEEIGSARKIIDNMIPANLGLQFDFETVLDGVTAWFGMAALYEEMTTLSVDGITSTDFDWLSDELDAYLTDELGIILFE